ncbi:MAG: hypothetical protein H6672_02870 [Anaerolineaceae bacterium]|nr:hypothetical protein [Anaerolineaceae bacterium]
MAQILTETPTFETELEPVILWARLISNVFSPPVVWAVMAFPIALRDAPTQGQAILWGVVYTALVCVFPLAYIAWMVHRGKITDIHMKLRKDRLRPFLVSIVCTAIAWWILRLLGAPPVVPQFALFSLVQLTVMAVITLVWQISMHAMSISCAVVAIALLFGLAPALVATPLIPLVGAARLKLHRHTPAQVIAGVVLGALIPVLLFAASV